MAQNWLITQEQPLLIATANQFPGFLNVRNFGAKGDGVTDDTAALVAAFSSLQTALQSSVGVAILYLPAGIYLCSSELTLTNVSGGLIQGDGPQQTVIQEPGGTSLIGAIAQVRFINCDHTMLRDIGLAAANHFGRLSSGASSGSGSVVVTSFGGGAPIVGQKCTINNLNGTGELLTVRAVVGTTVTFITTLKNNYAPGDYLTYGVFAGHCNYSDKTISGAKVSTNNRCENVSTGSVSAVQANVGFANTCRGGGPMLLAAPASIGQLTVSVNDVGEAFEGEVISFNDDTHVNNTDALTIAVGGINKSANQITFTSALTANHTNTNSLCYLASNSDLNNEEHVYINCRNTNAMLAGWYFDGQNQLSNTLVACIADGVQIASIYAYRGGSAVIMATTFSNSAGWDLIFGGPQQHPWSFVGCTTESATGAFQADPASGLQGLNVRFTNHDKKGGPVSGRAIDCTGFATSCSFTASNFDVPVATSFYFLDRLAGSFYSNVLPATVSMAQTRFGIGAATFNGLYVTDIDNVFESNGVSLSVSNGAYVSGFSKGNNGAQLPGMLSGLTQLTMAPTAAPSVNDSLYVDSADNKLKFRGNSGTITTLANP